MRAEELEEMSPTAAAETEERGFSEMVFEKSPARTLSPRARIVVAVVLVVLALAAGAWYVHAQTYESTDDAQIDGHINAVSSRISGNVAKVYVEDNQTVHAGQVLVDLDPRELTIAEQQSAAQYAQASAQLDSAEPNIAITRNSNESGIAQARSRVLDARASLETAQHDRQSAASKLTEMKVTANRDQLQADRYSKLYSEDEASRQEYENYQATAQASVARLAQAEASLASAEKVVDQRQAELSQQEANLAEVEKDAPHQLETRLSAAEADRANMQLAHAVWDRSKLNLSYAEIVAPVSGIVTQRSVEPGNHISEGEQLLMLVDISDLWVTADFKETQLRQMHPGCRAKVAVDALGRSFDGTVESMPAITGSRASVLPPENATGNYVKVIQRLPVRIRLNPGQPQMNQLRPGMSVEATVYIK
jgi:membrane fusion protein, multidrug efflux system